MRVQMTMARSIQEMTFMTVPLANMGAARRLSSVDVACASMLADPE